MYSLAALLEEDTVGCRDGTSGDTDSQATYS